MLLLGQPGKIEQFIDTCFAHFLISLHLGNYPVSGQVYLAFPLYNYI
jgi:hypothetical protein